VTDITQAEKKKVNGRNIVTVDPQCQLRNATEQFGAYGLGFGVVPGSVVITYNETKEEKPTTFLMYDAIMFYLLDGQRAELPISAVQRFIYPTKLGYMAKDEDAQRKAETNAMSKALSRIGFNADVFMGQFEDKAYLDDLVAVQSIEKAENKEKAELDQVMDIKDYMGSALKDLSIKEMPINDFKKIYQKHIAYLDKRSKLPVLKDACIYAINEIDRVKNERVASEQAQNNK
jgi:hypothetical protein